MLPPTQIEVPSGTKAIYITAISLFPGSSKATVNWNDSSTIYGVDFEGPSSQYVLHDSTFKLPVIAINDNIPKEVFVSFDFNDTIQHQHHITGPTIKKVGFDGDATQVQISGYASDDTQDKVPTTITILFQRSLHGVVKFKK